MLKFQSVFSPLMVIMFSLNHAALFCIQLLMTCQVFAEIIPLEQRNISVSRGESVNLTCNTSQHNNTNATQINWTKDSYFFAFSISQNVTTSNFTSRIDLSSPSNLNISNVQLSDTGLYRCDLTTLKGLRAIKWNLTVSEEPEGNIASWVFLYLLTVVIGFLLCVFTSAICIYNSRISWTKTPNQDQEILSYAEFHVQLGRESLHVAPPQHHSCAEYRWNHKQRESLFQVAQFTSNMHEVQYKAE
ncbi:uncharacterized protein LOC131978554 [Centropristis striata]|uniref:uncharacterized protein LOC131978554 n=1 Tax=Centropristis striata TaxID=184440 RepID=UPI0027E02D45|nr:uncharacterized protein LOC131978554 [Centropristis striata]